MNVLKIDYKAANAPQLFTKSLHHTGFAVIVNHPVDAEATKKLYVAWNEFFNSSEKTEWLVNKKTQEGYVPPSIAEIAKGNEIRDLKEFYNFYAWGKCPVPLKQLTQQIYDQLFSVAATLLHWLDDNTPADVKAKFSETLVKMVENTTKNLFRINYYPGLTGKEEPGALRAAAHEDIDLLTVLTAGTQTGLQTQDLKGLWHDVPCDPGNLVINGGDMLEEASGGYYPSTTHRVLNPTGEEATLPRMSCPLFVHPRQEVVLSERYTAESYLTERLFELGLLKKAEAM